MSSPSFTETADLRRIPFLVPLDEITEGPRTKLYTFHSDYTRTYPLERLFLDIFGHAARKVAFMSQRFLRVR